MTAATPEPTVDVVWTVADAIDAHLPRAKDLDEPTCPNSACGAVEWTPYHVAEQVLAALRAAAGAPDVDALAEVARAASVGPNIMFLPTFLNAPLWTQDHWRRIIRAVLDRLAIMGGGGGVAVDEGPRWLWPDHWTTDDVLRDQHARYHDETGNLLGRDECGWERCGFWDAAQHLVEADLVHRPPAAAPVSVAAGDEAVERAARDSWAAYTGDDPGNWSALLPQRQEVWREVARAALRAGGDLG